MWFLFDKAQFLSKRRVYAAIMLVLFYSVDMTFIIICQLQSLSLHSCIGDTRNGCVITVIHGDGGHNRII